MTDKQFCMSCEASWYPTVDHEVCWACGAEGRPMFTFDKLTVMSMTASGGCTWSASDVPGPADYVLETAHPVASKQRGGDGE